MEIKLDPATLSNLADGHLETQFQDALAEIMSSVFNDLRKWERAGNFVTAKVEMEVLLSCDVTSGNISVAVRANLKRPKRCLISRSIYRRQGQWLVGEEPIQDPLPFPVRLVDKAPAP